MTVAKQVNALTIDASVWNAGDDHPRERCNYE